MRLNEEEKRKIIYGKTRKLTQFHSVFDVKLGSALRLSLLPLNLDLRILLRAVFKDKLSGYEKLLAKADIPSLYNRRLQDIAIFMYKIKHKLLPQGLCIFFSN